MTIEKFVEHCLDDILNRIYIDKPFNYDQILEFMIDDVKETSGYDLDGTYSSGDVDIAFRRFLEKQ